MEQMSPVVATADDNVKECYFEGIIILVHKSGQLIGLTENTTITTQAVTQPPAQCLGSYVL